MVETVQRFKGLENDAVVLVIPDSDGDVDRPLAYVGMSRARVLLFDAGIIRCTVCDLLVAVKSAEEWSD